MLSKTNGNGDTTVYSYNSMNRMISRQYPDSTGITYTYLPAGQQDLVTDTRGITNHDYDARNRLIKVTHPDNTTISYTYDTRGNQTSVTIPSGTTTSTYDALNRMVSVTDPQGGITSYTYDNAGNRKTITYPNGNVCEYTYDTQNRLIYLENRKSSGEIISSYAYTLDASGNRISVEEDNGRFVEYNYDDLYRLTDEIITDPILGDQVITYTYDPFGNRLTKTDASGTVTYTYNANDQMVSENDRIYTYDQNGNTIRKSDTTETITYGYDFENRLTSVQTGGSLTEYKYDAQGIRVSQTADGSITKYLVDHNRPHAQVLSESDGAGSLTVSYVYGDDLISQNRGNSYYYLYDGQMSTRQLADNSEAVLNEYTYDAFGVVLDQAGVVANNYMYTGEQFDPNAGFYYLRARYMNPATGRFVTEDPWTGNIHEPVTLHKYLYANMNPVMYSDPSGEISLMSLTVAGAITGALTGLATYSYTHQGDDFTLKGSIIWTISGATAGATLSIGGWYAWVSWGPALTTTISGTTYTVGRGLVNRWPGMKVLVGHYIDKGQSIAQVLRVNNISLEQYASQAAYVRDNYIYKTYNAGRGAYYYIRYLGTSPRGKAYLAFVVEKGGKIVSYRPLWVKEAWKYFPELFKKS